MKHKRLRDNKETIRAVVKCDPAFKEAEVLTRYAVAARYPSLEEEVNESEYLKPLELARQVVEWAEKVIKKGVSNVET